MSKFDKLLEKLYSLDKNMRFSEIEKILEYYGYKKSAPRGGSSHFTFRKNGKAPVTIPKHEPIKKVYIIMIRDVVEEERREADE